MRNLLLLLFAISMQISFSQTSEILNPKLHKYFTDNEKDTMSQEFIKVQNYLINDSWNIYYRGDKSMSHININKDTIDIRKFMVARKEYKSVFVNAYNEYVIEFFSKDIVKDKIYYILKK